jgi:hypothetical protein
LILQRKIFLFLLWKKPVPASLLAKRFFMKKQLVVGGLALLMTTAVLAQKRKAPPPPPEPPPPPVVMSQPVPPPPHVRKAKLPKDYQDFLIRNPSISSVGWQDHSIIIQKRNGDKEVYLLNGTGIQQAEAKYGKLPLAPPPPPPPPAPPEPPVAPTPDN